MRRVWIEIENGYTEILPEISHPPCGGCGLKFAFTESVQGAGYVTLHAEGVD